MGCQSLFSGKNKKNILECGLLNFSPFLSLMKSTAFKARVEHTQVTVLFICIFPSDVSRFMISGSFNPCHVDEKKDTSPTSNWCTKF